MAITNQNQVQQQVKPTNQPNQIITLAIIQ
jgi:hypothetical protein